MRLFVISTLLCLGGLPVMGLPTDDLLTAVSTLEAKKNVTAIAPADDAIAKRDLSNSCNLTSCYMVNDSRLSCSCVSGTTPRGINLRVSTLVLDACFANHFGNLVAQAGGAFSRSCTNARVYLSTVTGSVALWFEARCYNSNVQRDQWSSVRLGSAVANTNGVLTCFGSRGT